jgi:hypothetical protein
MQRLGQPPACLAPGQWLKLRLLAPSISQVASNRQITHEPLSRHKRNITPFGSQAARRGLESRDRPYSFASRRFPPVCPFEDVRRQACRACGNRPLRKQRPESTQLDSGSCPPIVQWMGTHPAINRRETCRTISPAQKPVSSSESNLGRIAPQSNAELERISPDSGGKRAAGDWSVRPVTNVRQKSSRREQTCSRSAVC